MRSGRRKAIAFTGFLYGLAMAYFAVMWGVDGPTLPMPLAASPLNVPAAVLDTTTSFPRLIPLMPVLIIVPILVAPFGWSAIAFFAGYARNIHGRMIIGAVLLAHYIGVAIWFYLEGADHMLRPFRILHAQGGVILGFYAAGQVLIGWALLRHRSEPVPNGPG